MKNVILLDIDSERDEVIKFSKPQEYSPKSPEESKQIFTNDITCLFEGFCQLVQIADEKGYINKEGALQIAIDHLSSMKSNK